MLTSFADTNCRGLNAVFMSGIFDSRSYRALAMLVSSSDGRCLDGLVGAILFSAGAAMIAVVRLELSVGWSELLLRDGFGFTVCVGLGIWLM